VIPVETLIQLGVTLAEGVAKVIEAIQNDYHMTQAEKEAALLRITSLLKDKDAKVQSTTL
jgi:hypothetical protein